MKRALSIFLTCVFLLGLLPTSALAADDQYLTWNGSQLVSTNIPASITEVTTDTTTMDDSTTDGWYIVRDTVDISSRVTVNGDVHLILANNCTLNAGNGINISEGSNSLTIYAQSTDEAVMGALTATGESSWSGIECGTDQVLTINGGNVTAEGGNGAGIGGGRSGSGGTITINGGKVTASGGSGAGIGGGYGSSGGTIIISGGDVTATSTSEGAGIGGGMRSSGGEITISGGSVTAIGNSGAGIGGGGGGDGGTIVIRGEATHVDASSTSGAGIGGGDSTDVSGAGGNITIEGGTVIATGGQSSAGIGGAGGLIGGGWDHSAGNGGTITITGGTVTATGGSNAPDIGGGNGTTGIAPTDKIEIDPGADVKNDSGGEPNYGPAHGEDTSKWETDENQHWHPCGISGCPDTSHQSKKEAHSFGDWVTDKYDHWKECEICKRKTDETSHTYNQETVKPEALKSAADCVNPATYYKSCECGKVSTNDNETFPYGSALTHNMTHHEAVDPTCTQTGNKEYWSCSRCNKNFSDSGGTTEINDVTLDRVEHSWATGWSNDGDNHWHGCTVCGEKKDIAAHIGNAEVCNAPQTCTECGYQMTDALNHNWGGWVSNDDGTHTRTCKRNASHTETGDCSGGTATCSAQAICSACGGPYGSTNSGNHTGGTEIRDKKEATTSAESYTGDTYCLGCGEKIAVGTTIPKLSGGGGGSYTPPSTPTYPPTVEKPGEGGGTPAVSPSNPKPGDPVIVTPKPDEGYEVDKITVTDKNGKPVEVTVKPDGTYTFKQPSGKVKIEVSYKAVEKPWNNPFTDVSEGDWYYEAVRFVQERSLMNGYSDGRFGANDTLSRAQLAQILFNKEGRPGVDYLLDFPDVAGEAWYTEAVRWAASQGIVGGYGNGTFGPNDPITREQLAVMLWRYSGSPAATNKELHFNDTDEISGFALGAMRWAVENGILNGYGDGRLGPQGQATRAQVAQMLKNFIEKG